MRAPCDLAATSPRPRRAQPRLTSPHHSTCSRRRRAESLRRAVENNLLPLSNMLELAQRMRKLQSFVHMSTAYVNAFHEGFIAEDAAPQLPGIDAEVVLQQVVSVFDAFFLI